MNDAPQSLSALRELIENAPSADDDALRAARARQAAINQLSGWLSASLKVIPLALDRPTGDIAREAAMDEAACLTAWREGMAAFESAGGSGPAG